MNKPNKQTVCPHSSVNELYAATKLKKVRNLGGKLGDSLVEQFNCDTMADVAKLSEEDLSHAFGEKTGYILRMILISLWQIVFFHLSWADHGFII